MTTASRRSPVVLGSIPMAALAAILGTPAAVAAPGVVPAVGARSVPVPGILLSIPTAAAGQILSTSVTDVTPRGDVIGGTINSVTEVPGGTQVYASTAQRWLRTPAGWRRQQLAQPDGTQSSSVAGLTDAGEAAGTLVDGTGRSQAVRWSAGGRRVVVLEEANGSVSAVGPRGPWGVHLFEPGAIPGDSELVDRRGRRTSLRGTPELEAGYDRTVLSLAGPGTAVVGVRNGIGRATTVTPVLYRDGATLALPVPFRFLAGTTCMTPVRPDGSLVYSGVQFAGGVPQGLLVRHVGGVPGQDVPLAAAGTIGTPIPALGCDTNGFSDRLAADGGVAGVMQEPAGAESIVRAAYWDGRGERTVVPLLPGERSTVGVAVATGGRMVIRAQTDAGPVLSLWHHGVRMPLTLPAGWSAGPVVDLSDTGLVVGVANDAAGSSRPVVWNTAGG